MILGARVLARNLGLPLRGLLHALESAQALMGDEVVQVVSVRPVAAEGAFVKQAHDAAVSARLVGEVDVLIVNAHRPAHVPMPAAATGSNLGQGSG